MESVILIWMNRADFVCCCSPVVDWLKRSRTMVTKTIPAGNYLVYTYEGDIKNLGEFYGKIFETYLPQSGHEMDMRPQLEVYDDRFMKTGTFDIYIPGQ